MGEKRPQYRAGLSSKYSMGSCGFVAEEQRWGSADGKLLRGNIRDKGGFWLKWPKLIPAEGRPGASDIT